jgi:hypothetical protein
MNIFRLGKPVRGSWYTPGKTAVLSAAKGIDGDGGTVPKVFRAIL